MLRGPDPRLRRLRRRSSKCSPVGLFVGTQPVGGAPPPRVSPCAPVEARDPEPSGPEPDVLDHTFPAVSTVMSPASREGARPRAPRADSPFQGTPRSRHPDGAVRRLAMAPRGRSRSPRSRRAVPRRPPDDADPRRRGHRRSAIRRPHGPARPATPRPGRRSTGRADRPEQDRAREQAMSTTACPRRRRVRQEVGCAATAQRAGLGSVGARRRGSEERISAVAPAWTATAATAARRPATDHA
jgi:hypothetical protein